MVVSVHLQSAVFTIVDRGTNGALHPPAHPVQTAAVYVGDLSSQQRTLTHHVCREVLPAHGQVLIWRRMKSGVKLLLQCC